MKSTPKKIVVKTLGGFRIANGSRRLELKWPSEKGRAIFAALLCPLDEYLDWDRLNRVIGDGAPDAGAWQDLNHELQLLADMFRELIGCNLVIVAKCGVWLDPGIMSVDARLLRDAAFKGFEALALGDDGKAVQLFREAALLYQGKFLPKFTGKIVRETRIELAELMEVVEDALSRACRSRYRPQIARRFASAPSGLRY